MVWPVALQGELCPPSLDPRSHPHFHPTLPAPYLITSLLATCVSAARRRALRLALATRLPEAKKTASSSRLRALPVVLLCLLFLSFPSFISFLSSFGFCRSFASFCVLLLFSLVHVPQHATGACCDVTLPFDEKVYQGLVTAVDDEGRGGRFGLLLVIC